MEGRGLVARPFVCPAHSEGFGTIWRGVVLSPNPETAELPGFF
jgi:hypothetical protein